MSSGERAPAGPASPRLVLALCLGLVLAVGALYAQTARHEFVSFDDGAYLTENPRVAGGLTAENVRWAFTRFHSANWHPLTWVSHQLDVELFGLAPGPHHLVNAALHALNAVLCFVFLRRATGSTWTSALVALLFAVHPQRVESVAWASERKDVLSGTFFFLTLLAYERHARAPGLGHYGLVALCFALGLLSKPMLVTLPIVLLLLDVWPLQRALFLKPWLASPVPSPSPAPTHPGESQRGPFLYAAFLEKLPLFLLAAGSALVTLVAQRAGGAVQPMEALTLSQRLATAVLGTLTYLRQAVWPQGLCFFYPHPALVEGGAFEPLGWRVWLAASLLVALALLAWRARARFPFVLVGLGWFLVMLSPVIGIVQVGSQLCADRYAYLPLLGPTIALAFLGRELVGGSGFARPAFGLGLGIAALHAVVAYRQIGTWRDSGTLSARALDVTTGNYVAHEHRGLWLQRRGELAAAKEHYLAALASAPRLPSSHVDLGAVHAQLGQREEAELRFREALRLVPDHLEARMSLGLLHQHAGDLEGALLHYEIAAREHVDERRVWLQLAEVQFALARHPAARASFQRARAVAGPAAELELGASLSPVAEERQAWVLATSSEPGERDPERALALLAACAARHPGGSWTHARVLAAAQAAAGRLEEAVRSAAEASALAPSTEWPRLKAERELYAAGRALGR
jgi:tetratricopeptide (TPR) repeat protein